MPLPSGLLLLTPICYFVGGGRHFMAQMCMILIADVAPPSERYVWTLPVLYFN